MAKFIFGAIENTVGPPVTVIFAEPGENTPLVAQDKSNQLPEVATPSLNVRVIMSVGDTLIAPLAGFTLTTEGALESVTGVLVGFAVITGLGFGSGLEVGLTWFVGQMREPAGNRRKAVAVNVGVNSKGTGVFGKGV